MRGQAWARFVDVLARFSLFLGRHGGDGNGTCGRVRYFERE